MRDPRIQGQAFIDLVAILRDALGRPEQINTIATQLDLTSEISWSGNAEDQWTSLISIADNKPGTLDQLLNLVAGRLEKTVHFPRFLIWQQQQGSRIGIKQAVIDLRRSRKELLSIPDPRKANDSLQGMRSAMTEIEELVLDRLVSDPLFIVIDRNQVAQARDEVLDACRGALASVDQLMTGIADARRIALRFRYADQGQEAFVVDRTVIRLLLDDRSIVDRASQTLLEVIRDNLDSGALS